MIVVIFDLSPQSKEVGVQLQEDLIKVLNELYTVRKALYVDNVYIKLNVLHQWGESCSHIRVSSLSSQLLYVSLILF